MASKVELEDFPQLDQAAKKRVQDALHQTLERELELELRKAGHSPAAVFGDGSVKGKTVQRQ